MPDAPPPTVMTALRPLTITNLGPMPLTIKIAGVVDQTLEPHRTVATYNPPKEQ